MTRRRADLLRQLQAAGVSLGELREAVEQNRLALLPVEAVLRDGAACRLADMAAYSELDEAILRQRLRALGVGETEAGATCHGDALEAAAALRELQDAGGYRQDPLGLRTRRAERVARDPEVFGSAFSQPGMPELTYCHGKLRVTTCSSWGNYAYADGGLHVRVTAAFDALVGHRARAPVGAALSGLATPTDAFVVPEEIIAGISDRRLSRRRHTATPEDCPVLPRP